MSPSCLTLSTMAPFHAAHPARIMVDRTGRFSSPGRRTPSLDVCYPERKTFVLAPLDDLPKGMTSHEVSDLVQKRQAFVELLVRLAGSSGYRWDPTAIDFVESRNSENEFWPQVLRGLDPGLSPFEAQSTRLLLLAMPRPRFLLRVQSDVSILDLPSALMLFVDGSRGPHVEDALQAGGLDVKAYPPPTETVEIGLEITTGEINSTFMTDLLEVFAFAQRAADRGGWCKLSALRFGDDCVQPKALENLGQQRVAGARSGVPSLALGDIRAGSLRECFYGILDSKAHLSSWTIACSKSFPAVVAALRNGGESKLERLDVALSTTDLDAAWLAFALFHRDSSSTVSEIRLRPTRQACAQLLTREWVGVFARVLQSVRPFDLLLDDDPDTLDDPAETRVFVRLSRKTTVKEDPVTTSKTLCNLWDLTNNNEDQEVEEIARHGTYIAIIVPGAGVGWVPAKNVRLRREVQSQVGYQQADVLTNQRITSFSWDSSSTHCVAISPQEHSEHVLALLELLTIIGEPLTRLELPNTKMQSDHLVHVLALCPNLTDLSIAGHSMTDLQPLVNACTSGRCKISTLDITSVEPSPPLMAQMTEILRGPGSCILRRIVLDQVPLGRELLAFLSTLRDCPLMEHVHIYGVYVGGYSDEMKMRFLSLASLPSRSRPMQLRSKCAWLSVVHSHHQERALGRLDASMISRIFLYAREIYTPPVLLNPTRPITVCSCGDCRPGYRPLGVVED